MAWSASLHIPVIPLFHAAARNLIQQTEISKAVSHVLADMETDAKALTPFFRGDARRSIRQLLTPVGSAGVHGQLLGGGDRAPHFVFLERGTRPHFPPPRALEAWAQAKLGDASLAFVVARAIARRGTPALRMMQTAWDAHKGQIQPAVARGMRVAIRQWLG